MRQIAARKLWLGHAGDLRDPRALLSAGIEAVVELADSEPLAVLPRELVRCRFPLSDGGVNPPWLLRLASESVAALFRAGVPTVVCCACGMSRSVCIAACGIALAEGRPLEESLSSVVGSGPADVSPGLLAQLRQALVGEAPGSGGWNEGMRIMQEVVADAQKQDLQRRLAAYDANPKAGSTWEEVRARLRGQP